MTPVGSGSGSGSGGSAKPGTSTVNSAYRSYLTGDRSELTLGILRAAGLPVTAYQVETKKYIRDYKSRAIDRSSTSYVHDGT